MARKPMRAAQPSRCRHILGPSVLALLPNKRMQEATWQGRHDKREEARRGSG